MNMDHLGRVHDKINYNYGRPNHLVPTNNNT